MYRKDKIAVAVDNYKRRYSNDDNDETSSKNDISEIDDTSEESDSNEKLIKKKEIDSVSPANKVTTLVEKNQTDGLNLFLQKMKSINTSNKVNKEKEQNKHNNFNLIDPNKVYYPPNPFTVTSINQAHDLLRVANSTVSSIYDQSSEDWLKSHNLDALNLNIEDLISKGKLGQPRPDQESGTAVNCLIYDDLIVTDFEYKLHMAIEMYSKRIKWYLQGSRKLFGYISGSRVGVLIDASEANLGFGRLLSFQDNLLHLLDEQLYKKKSIKVGFFGTSTSFLWDSNMDLNCRVVEDIKEAIVNMTQMGGCNLMNAIKQIVQDKSIDQVLLILGACPDQNTSQLLYFLQQLLLGRDVPFHCVSYESQSEEVSRILKSIADISHGNYHRYSSITEELIYTSNDIDLLLSEIEKCQAVLSKVALMRQGHFTNRISPIINQIANELKTIPQYESLPMPPTFNEALKFEKPKYEVHTSNEWLTFSSLKSKKLGLFSKKKLNIINNKTDDNTKINLDVPNNTPSKEGQLHLMPQNENIYYGSHQGSLLFSKSINQEKPSKIKQNTTRSKLSVLSILDSMHDLKLNKNDKKSVEIFTYNILGPNSYENKSEFIPSIGRMVTSSVYEKAMIQVEWPDGSVRNVHADLTQLFEYQKILGEQVKLLEQRINWLATGSRRIFGTIVEKKIVIILDFSISNLKYLVHILQSLKMLMQQQLLSKDKFNIVEFSSKVSTFKPNLVPVSESSLQEAWEWLKTRSCSGSRNFLGALKTVLENPVDSTHNDMPHGIYLFTSGVPDQQIEPLMAYLEERLLGTQTKIHTVLFNVDDYDNSGAPIPSRYANITKTAEIMRMISHNTNGRFHWFRESGIIESDDIRVLMSEIDLAIEYSRRTQEIIKDFKEKYPDSHLKLAEKEKIKQEAEICRKESSDNMIALLPPRQTSLSKARLKYLSVKSDEAQKIPKALAYRSTVDPRKSVTNAKSVRPPILSAFYTEDKNSKGVVYRDISDQIPKSRKGIGKTVIPDKEEWISSKEWMKKYSLKNMGLDLMRLVSGPDCKHEESLIVPLEKYVEAKYCAGLFPIVNVRGTRKHLQYTTTELNRYSVEARKALLRYIRRLEWLTIGSKRIFGVITEHEVAILLDTSGSMTPHMPELIVNLKALIWEQLFKRKINYNIIAFNSQIRRFHERLVIPDESNCHSAIGWTEHLVASGNTDTSKALSLTLEDPRIQGIYLLSDGKPDSSTEVVLKAVQEMISKRKSKVIIHTISFNCEDNTANDFLKKLSKMTGGRYHKVCHDYDIRLFSQRVLEQSNKAISSEEQVEISFDRTFTAANILSFDPFYPALPQLDGDDLNRIAKEIQLTRENLSKINYFHQLHLELQNFQEEQRILRLEEAKRNE